MRRVLPHVSAAGSLIFLGFLVFGLVRSDVVDMHWLFLFPAVGAIVLGIFVLVLHWLGWWRR